MADLKQLQIRRRQIKSALTRFGKYLETANESIDVNQVKDRQSKFCLLWDDFNNVQTQIELIVEEMSSESTTESNSNENNERELFEETYFSLSSKTTKLIENACSSSNCKSSPAPSNPSQICAIRLPEVNLPTFTGTLETWCDFYNTFNSLIHLNNSLTKVQKLQYLKSALQGEAALILTAIDMSDFGYDIAWDLVKKRYENKRYIVNKHISSLIHLPAMNKENAAILRKIIDDVTLHVRSLKALGRPVDSWDDMLIHIITSKLDFYTSKEWEASLQSDVLPNLNQLIEFLTRKCGTLEAISRNQQFGATTSGSHASTATVRKQYSQANLASKFKSSLATHVSANGMVSCAFCSKEHTIYQCKAFLELSVHDRLQEIAKLKLCKNCLRKGHSESKCNSGNCRKCGRHHNTLVHQESSNKTNETIISNHARLDQERSQILLSTAVVDIQDAAGRYHKCRALLDCGSQSCFATEELIKRLGLKKETINIPVTGINQRTTYITKKSQVAFKSRFNSYTYNIKCLILNQITDSIPLTAFNKSLVTIPKGIQLADPDFCVPSNIDLLLGAEIFWSLLCVGQLRPGKGQPTLQKTTLGWIISGHINNNNNEKQGRTVCNFVTNEALDNSISRFWKLEECSGSSQLNLEEQHCEEHFINTFRKNNTGRFIVQIPLKQPATVLGDSRAQATKRFYALERKLARNSSLREEYTNFIHEYLFLKHMKPVHTWEEDHSTGPSFYLPHHAVIKQTSLTTKLRVVFDGSARSTSGMSLNNIQMVGPTIQDDLFSILSRFRIHQYVITADVAKMYRQILVDKSQTHLQRILWRDHPAQQLKTYELATVTYGTASASFLAIRCLRQLAIEAAQEFPLGSRRILNDFYVDDLLTGANSTHEAQSIYTEVSEILSRAGFELRKWASNDPTIIQNTNPSDMFATLSLDKDETVSTLGLQWNASTDILKFSQPTYTEPTRITKRVILASVAQIFDPLGLIGPTTLVAKLLIQQLWQAQTSWDESVPLALQTQWMQFKGQLQLLQSLSIPRCVGKCLQPVRIEVHGFSDASEQAYGACIYIVTHTQEGKVFSNLMCSKSRVAPLKVISLPRLELCGALLLARLMSKLLKTLHISYHKLYYWTDSMITLTWITATAKNWKTFVANRVGEIQSLTNCFDWGHVAGCDNPADLISRGAPLNTLIDSQLWWLGPIWLRQGMKHYPPRSSQTDLNLEAPEQRKAQVHACTILLDEDLFSKFSTYLKLMRVTAYCLRFASNLKLNLKERVLGPLSVAEMKKAKICLIKAAQRFSFAKEFKDLASRNNVHAKSPLRGLNPFLDRDGAIRVGGRLKNANLPYSHRHPYALPTSHQLTKVIINHEHCINLHAGIQTTLAAVRRSYWPLRARNLVKGVIHECIKCFKAKPKGEEYIMGDLPSQRITPSRPFSNCGVDYFGPLSIREGKRRNSRIVKGYGAIFVCFCTKAVHIELVRDLTSEAFLGAMKRFIARRGRPANIYSDNGTNFSGANQELQELHKLFTQELTKNKIINNMSAAAINWHFIPPRAPHFGGIWEAAVKSTKHHMRRIIGNAFLSYEEMHTLLAQIEAILNSRPLIPLSDDPNDMACLTPGHFLIGDSLTSEPEPGILEIPTNRLSRWQHVEFLRQHFWTRWSKEYLSQLQQRGKWQTSSVSRIQPGRLVLIREDGLPPLRWLTGRIEHIHPGADGVTRAATVRTATGLYKRPVVKLCPLPIDDGDVKEQDGKCSVECSE